MSEKSHILVTPKGLQLQSEILKETLSEFPRIKNSKSVGRLRVSKPPQARQSPQCSIPDYYKPKSGYFGPKERHVFPPINSPRPRGLYPNYLNKEPTENPPRHFCIWKPESTTRGKNIPVEIPNGKYIHHTLYTLAQDSSLMENPSIHGLNRAVFGKEKILSQRTVEAETLQSWEEIDVLKDSMERSQNATPLKTGVSKLFGNTGFSINESRELTKFENTMRGKSKNHVEALSNKGERLMKRYFDNKKTFERILEKVSQETKKKLKRRLEGQNEDMAVLKKKDHREIMEEHDSVVYSGEVRYAKRLQEYQNKRYEKIWNKHAKSLEQLTERSKVKDEETRTDRKIERKGVMKALISLKLAKTPILVDERMNEHGDVEGVNRSHKAIDNSHLKVGSKGILG